MPIEDCLHCSGYDTKCDYYIAPKDDDCDVELVDPFGDSSGLGRLFRRNGDGN